jgi:PAS domain S-box-containing protein
MPDVSFTEPRSKRYAFSQETVLMSWTRIYARKGVNIQSIIDLEGKKIAVMTGSVNFTGPEGIKELTRKFDIDCTFVEMNNYTEVFEALEKGEIDAGVTNKDFGNKYEKDFNIEKTSIIFRPSHIQFAFPKDSSLTPYLLEKIDYHMKELKKNKDSIYYQSLEKWLAVKVGERQVIPGWINWMLVGIGVVVLLLFGGNFILRSQVRSKTKELRQDIFERKQAEEELRASRDYLEKLTNSMWDAVFSVKMPERVIEWANDSFKLIGYEPSECIGKDTAFLYADKDGFLDFGNKLKDAMVAGKDVLHSDQLMKRKNGETFPAEITVTFHRENDEVVSVTSIVRDITERKKAEDELRGSEEKIRAILDASPDVIHLLDINGIILATNESFAKRFGLKIDDVVGKCVFDYTLYEAIHQRKAAIDRRKAAIDKIFKTGEPLQFEDKGLTGVFESHIHPIFNPAGEVKAVAVYARDITEQKQAEETLVENEAVFKGIFSQAPIGIELYDSDGNLISVNQECLNIFGVRNVEEIKGFKLFEDPNVSAEAKNKLRNGELVDYQSEFDFEVVKKLKLYKTTRSGKCFLHLQITPYNISDLGNKGFVVHVQDITEQKQAEERIKKTMNATINTVSNMIEAKDPYTSGHQHRVCQLAVPLAQELGLPPDKIEGIRIASLIHDIGKISVPTEILSKSTKLSDIEFSLIKVHSQIGYNILKSIDFPYPVASIVLQHHEKINGSGYPGGLKGDEILLEAKIICVADVVEAMSSHRPYRPALGIDAALEEITQNKGILYDPKAEEEFKFE